MPQKNGPQSSKIVALPVAFGPVARRLCASITMLGSLSTAALSQISEHGDPSVDIAAWIDDLTDQRGKRCCSDADGVRPQAVDWIIGANQYRVLVDGQWLDVPDNAIIRGPNYLGYAIVWLLEKPVVGEGDVDYYVEFPYVRCFLPGPAI